MLAVHPVVQALATVIAFYVFYLGLGRFQSLHLKKKKMFNWKRHVLLGKISLITWLIGMGAGFAMAYRTWERFLVTGDHGETALIMLPFILFGLVSGMYMDKKKKRRRALPLIHGASNVTLLIFSIHQVYSGWWVYNTYVLGR